MYGNGVGTCRSCGRRIKFIDMKSGKKMPVDESVVCYVPDTKGKDRIVTPDGSVVAGSILEPDDPMVADPRTRMGYISHFATCGARKR